MKKKKLNIESSGFKVPKNYFEELDNEVLERIKSNSVLSDSINSGFSVPDSYFDSINDSVLSQLNKPRKVISFIDWKRASALSGIAAALLICAAIFFNTNTTDDDLSVDMVENYFISQNLDTYELAQLLNDTDYITEDISLTESSYEEANLESYLLENSDIELLIE